VVPDIKIAAAAADGDFAAAAEYYGFPGLTLAAGYSFHWLHNHGLFLLVAVLFIDMIT